MLVWGFFACLRGRSSRGPPQKRRAHNSEGDICLHFTHDAFTTHYLPAPRWHRYDMNNYWYLIKASITHCLKKETTHGSIPRMHMSSIIWRGLFFFFFAAKQKNFNVLQFCLKASGILLRITKKCSSGSKTYIGFVLNPREKHFRHQKHIPDARLFQNAALCDAFAKI